MGENCSFIELFRLPRKYLPLLQHSLIVEHAFPPQKEATAFNGNRP